MQYIHMYIYYEYNYISIYMSLSIRKLAMGAKKRPAAIKRPAARTRQAS